MARRDRSRATRGWFVAFAAVLVLALLGLIVAAVVDYLGKDSAADPRPGARRPLEPAAPRSADDGADALDRARRFYTHVIERRLKDAAALAVGAARDRVMAMDAASQARNDPELGAILDDTLRGQLEDFAPVGPVRATAPGRYNVDARAVVHLAGVTHTVRVWFALRKDPDGWRVEDYRPEAETPVR